MSVVIREAVGDDLRAVVDIGHRTWPSTFGPIAGEDYVQLGLAKWWTQEATIPAIRAGRVLVAEVDGEVVGMCSVGHSEGHLWMWKLYVLPEHHGQGLGSGLLKVAVQRAEDDGESELWLSYLVGNDPAARFYARHGFEEVRRDASGSGIPDSVVVRRVLHATGGGSHLEHGQEQPV